MFFQINVTPKAKKGVAAISHETPEPTAVLILEPFQPQTRVKLETNINTKASVNLTLRNPTSRSQNVKVTKYPPTERSIVLDNSELVLQPESDSFISLSWTPKELGSWRDILQFTDSRRIKYDVALTLICSNVKKGWTKGTMRNRVLAQSNEIPTINNGTKNKTQAPKIITNEMNITANSKYDENKENFMINTMSNIMNSDDVNTASRLAGVEYHNSISINSLDISHFQLTPINTHEYKKSTQIPQMKIVNATNLNPMLYMEEQSALPEIRILNATEMDFILGDANIISPKNNENKPILRRETYLNPEPKFCKQMDSIEESLYESFEDSLVTQQFPPEKNDQCKQNFSMILENITNFTTPIKTISPAACSTGRKSDSDSNRISPSDSSPLCVTNNTFNIITVDSPVSATSNNIYNDNKSPKSAFTTRNIRPSRLTATFAKLSSNSPTEDPTKINFITSSPTSDHRRVSFATSNLQSNDSSSVKAVLEADLWANNDRSCHASLLSYNRGNIYDTSQSMTKETVSVTKQIIVGYNEDNTESYVTAFEKPSRLCVNISSLKEVVDNTRRVVTTKKISPLRHNKITKDKGSIQQNQILRKKVQDPNKSSKQRSNMTTPGVRITKLCLKNLDVASVKNKSTTAMDTIKNTSKNSVKHHSSLKISRSDDVIRNIRNRDLFAATMTEDPFLSHNLYYDEQWIHRQELEFTKWLNALLTPVEHSADVETTCIDVGKIWQSCRKKENTLAETKEAVSARYHNTNTSLNTLRKAAYAMFARDEVKTVLTRVVGAIDKGTFVIRPDRNLNRDIGLQKAILELLLSYNPLWLRIGLEVVYGEAIPLNSNNDLIGLTRFLISRFFSDPYLAQTYSYPNIICLKFPEFQLHMNKFLLKKFFFIVYFLDYAKRNKLIGHDPCLFHKKAPNKDSRAILLCFAREVLAGVGDLTKVLRTYEYVVSHKQTYLDEYNYAVKDISSDLRDGVRLCRIMELIIGDRTLTGQCRVPSISRLQKIYNVDLALKALNKAGYEITGDIDAKSIADGHREKTLSLLWQIIYKFQRPRFEHAAISLQKWWRAKLWYVRVKNYLSQRQNNAACVIQRGWRHYQAKKICWENYRNIRNNISSLNSIAITIQKWWRLVKYNREYRVKRNSIIKIQRWWRNLMITRPIALTYSSMRKSTIYIQKSWRMKRARRKYLKIKYATQVIQTQYRAIRTMNVIRNEFIKKKNAIIHIQSWWRMIQVKRVYLRTLKQHRSALIIQKRWRAKKIGYEIRKNYMKQKTAAILIQRKYRAMCTMKIIRNEFIKKKNAIIHIQSWWQMIQVKRFYLRTLKQHKNALIIQKRWRAKKIGYEIRENYMKQKTAAILIQRKYRAMRTMKVIRNEFIKKKNATIHIQSWWQMIKIKRFYLRTLKQHKSALIIQKRWRAKKIGYEIRENYMKQKAAAIQIQRKYRSIKLAQPIRVQFLTVKRAVIIIQKNWRMLRAIRDFQKKKYAIIIIQTQWRAMKLATVTQQSYINMKNAAIIIQRFYRSWRINKIIHNEYLVIYRATLTIQRIWRAKKLMQQTRKQFIEYRNAVIRVQSFWRMIRARRTYKSKINSCLIIQRAWRRIVIARTETLKKQNIEFLKKQKYNNAATIIQASWRGYKVRAMQSVEICELRLRSKRAAKTATPSATVEYRLQSAMDLLQNFRNIGQLSMCLACIDTLTRLSPKGCILFCELNLIDRLYMILEKANRSLPWMDVCKRCTNILITLAKLPETKARVRNIEETETIVRLMNTALKYDVDLFLHLATFFWLLLNDSEFTSEVKKSQPTIWLFKTLIVSAKKQEKTTLLKVKNKDTSIGSGPMLLPNLNPDWGFETRNPRCFTTIHHAISALIAKLDITPTL